MEIPLKTKSFVSYVYRCGNMLLKICAMHGVKTEVHAPWIVDGNQTRPRGYRTITITCEEKRMNKIVAEWMESMRIKF